MMCTLLVIRLVVRNAYLALMCLYRFIHSVLHLVGVCTYEGHDYLLSVTEAIHFLRAMQASCIMTMW